eukprot:g1902.t1
MYSVIASFLLGVTAVSAADPFTWKPCATSATDRIITKDLELTTESGKFAGGETATIKSTGITNLHSPLAWTLRVYETGMPKKTGDFNGDLLKAIHFDDAKNTTFDMQVQFPLPLEQKTGEFMATFSGTDQQKAQYFCVQIGYNYTSTN